MFRRGILLLHDRHDAAVLADDAAVTERPIDVCGEHRREGPARVMRLDQRSQRRRPQQRHVAIQEHHGAAAPSQVRFRLEQRVRRTELRLLQCKQQAQPFPKDFLNALRTVTQDHDCCLRPQRVGGPQDVLDQRHAEHAVHHLRFKRFHSRPFAGREDDDVSVGHGRRRS